MLEPKSTFPFPEMSFTQALERPPLIRRLDCTSIPWWGYDRELNRHGLCS